MDTFLELQEELQSSLNITSASSLFPATKIKSALNRSYIKASRLFRWPALSDSQVTSTEAGLEYYDAPENWSPQSVWRLEIGGVLWGEEPDGSPLSFTDYLTWKIDNPAYTDKKWTLQWLRYFIFPIPATDGADNITIWGQKNVDKLISDDDKTIFSHNMPEGNEAILMEAEAILRMKKDDVKTGAFVSDQAKQILLVASNKIRQEQSKIEKIQPFFHVPDYFSSRRTTLKNKIGEF